MQGTPLWSPVYEDATCLRATKLMCLNSWARTLEAVHCTAEARLPRGRAPQQDKPRWEAWAPHLGRSSCSPQLEKAHTQQQDQAQPKVTQQMNKIIF